MVKIVSNTPVLVSYPPVSKASREVANLTGEKIHIPIYGVKEFVCLSVTKCDPNYLRTVHLSSNQNQKTIKIKFACLAARAVFESLFLL